MKVELLVLAITGFFIANTYHDGKYMAMVKSWTKYYKMAGIAFAGLSAYLFFKKYPSDSRTLLSAGAGVIRHLPVDRGAVDFLDPFIQMTKSSGNMDFTQQAQTIRKPSKVQNVVLVKQKRNMLPRNRDGNVVAVNANCQHGLKLITL